jgi:hypothetical protein
MIQHWKLSPAAIHTTRLHHGKSIPGILIGINFRIMKKRMGKIFGLTFNVGDMVVICRG